MTVRSGWMLVVVVLAACGACKKQEEAGPRGGGGVEPPAAPLDPGEGRTGDLERGGAAAPGTVSQPGSPAASPVQPPAGLGAPAGEVPRALPCPPREQAWEPTEPDPEAGDFTLEEALAGLGGSGPPTATIETSLGTITCRLAGDLVPRAVANFVGLARGLRPWWEPCRKAWVREPYYDGLQWHRVIPGFMAQGGDPWGDGSGGPGYMFANEIAPELRHDRPGTLAYANSGRDTNGSQFYVTVGKRPQLDGGYVVFGYCEGVEVVQQIVRVPRDANDKPLRPVLIRRVTITRE